MSAPEFQQNVQRDAWLVEAAFDGGFDGACACAMHMSMNGYDELKGGPDRVIRHGEWFAKQPAEYKQQVVEKIVGGPSD